MDADSETRDGALSCPSGVLVIIDMGYLGIWSASGPPTATGRPIGYPSIGTPATAAVDLRIDGQDAEAAARAFDRQPHTYLYDIPEAEVEALGAAFRDCVDSRGLQAALVVEHNRVSHGERARRAAAAGGGEFLYHGVRATALPVSGDEPLPVVATAVDFGDGVGTRWRDVAIRARQRRTPVAPSRIGAVQVDWGHILLADLDVLGDWVHEDTLDGLADLAYWGADAAAVGAEFGGEPLEAGVAGWRNLPIDDAIVHVMALDEWKERNGARFVQDFRPHSHHFHALEKLRGARLGWAEVLVGGGRAIALTTSWGGGLFPVRREDGTFRVALGEAARAPQVGASG